jgi:hypothetical protein
MSIIFSLLFVSCSDKRADYVDYGGSYAGRSGPYTYPDDPAENLRDYLQKDSKARGLRLEISDITKTEGTYESHTEFRVNFNCSSGNVCVISFATSDYYMLDGKSNPSFTIAFKYPDNWDDMITVLTSVVKYLSPALSFEEATELAVNQDKTISTDGYSMPQDIGGYQVVTRYTNPHISQAFDAKLSVTVTALKQIWGGVDVPSGKELISRQDYHVITPEYMPWKDNYQTGIVFADFIIKNVWDCEDWVHGDYWAEIDVESMDGDQFTLRLETVRMPIQYEFGVGQQYTLYIETGLAHGATIVCAIQRTSSVMPNSRGSSQPLDYPTNTWKDPPERIDPEINGVIYNVSFYLISYGMITEPAAVLEGRSVGKKQWPSDPKREEYEFAGWYDNEGWTGNSYTVDTPIFQDTDLYAKWKYVGPGGYWPRAHRGDIQGIDDGGVLSGGQKAVITVSGYNMNTNAPKDQRFRWLPASWKLSDGTKGNFPSDAPFQASLIINSKGDGRLYITYLEEIFDGVGWQATGQSREVEEVAFRVD